MMVISSASVPVPLTFARSVRGPRAARVVAVLAEVTPAFLTASLADALSECGNDLTLPATGILPEICDVLNALAREEGCLLARMSGSGATCFGIYDTNDQAERAAHAIAAQNPDWWISPTHILTQQLWGPW